jgi:hypothetical protein
MSRRDAASIVDEEFRNRSGCEGQSLSKKDLQQVQDHSAQRRGAHPVRQYQAQTKTRLTGRQGKLNGVSAFYAG